jgi:hypothetical protein
MAIALADLQAQRDQLTWMIGRGVLKMTVDGQHVEYVSTDALLKARAAIDIEMAKLTPIPTPTFSLGQYSKDGRGNAPRD